MTDAISETDEKPAPPTALWRAKPQEFPLTDFEALAAAHGKTVGEDAVFHVEDEERGDVLGHRLRIDV